MEESGFFERHNVIPPMLVPTVGSNKNELSKRKGFPGRRHVHCPKGFRTIGTGKSTVRIEFNSISSKSYLKSPGIGRSGRVSINRQG